jgi:hypothetical protein
MSLAGAGPPTDATGLVCAATIDNSGIGAACMAAQLQRPRQAQSARAGGGRHGADRNFLPTPSIVDPANIADPSYNIGNFCRPTAGTDHAAEATIIRRSLPCRC